ncbi:MAG: hypothetical protein A3D67_04205 [Candidatus Lloydbacteria bacterium RIFCSPHIGHO2_02_FULL_51_22]|uniref:Uncharacterized protein n=2 Tax=Candidatus Lloydiibacteriota TaxID=1817910 RepID=A0A1G2DHY5_9BACT|nr:MAG: hypothetical protein A3D67_04205 [Candidatus Lloydbacteria bacterium RIFCSPHIGHO2_02_FULL_51_22]OGZ17343.1 MAG: hypothetical protein A3G11_00215 [Candidatus Lloydbacteria bacterium RIFCSPLOWO2_12_FULL_51_9]
MFKKTWRRVLFKGTLLLLPRFLRRRIGLRRTEKVKILKRIFTLPLARRNKFPLEITREQTVALYRRMPEKEIVSYNEA